MGNSGLGVKISNWSDGNRTIEALQAARGKVIQTITMKAADDRGVYADSLILGFNDSALEMWDDGQSCCETRYMHTDDDLTGFLGAEFRNIEVRDAPNRDDESEEHEVQFLLVHTSLGTFTIETHNIHNGYYGGFSVVARTVENSV